MYFLLQPTTPRLSSKGDGRSRLIRSGLSSAKRSPITVWVSSRPLKSSPVESEQWPKTDFRYLYVNGRDFGIVDKDLQATLCVVNATFRTISIKEPHVGC